MTAKQAPEGVGGPGTPLPWKLTGATLVYSTEGTICAMSQVRHSRFVEFSDVGPTDPDFDEACKNAAYIVHACNCFPELLEALEKTLAHYEFIAKLVAGDRIYEIEKATGKRVRKSAREVVSTECEAAAVFLRETLTKARGQ